MKSSIPAGMRTPRSLTTQPNSPFSSNPLLADSTSHSVTSPTPSNVTATARSLEYWIGQTSALSDSLIESQLKRTEAEKEAIRLAPFETAVTTLQAELRVLSEQKANALVENARMFDMCEQLRQLTQTQEQELIRLRRLNSENESANVALQAQLSSAHTASASLNSAVQLQQAYQAKVANVESQLAESQRQVAEFQTLQFNYQVLHQKYEHLKRVREGTSSDLLNLSGTHGALQERTRMLEGENNRYRAQMESVVQEMENIRRDLLAREEEREGVLSQMIGLGEARDALQQRCNDLESENSKLDQTIHRLTHGMRMARARTFQQIDHVRDFQARIKREVNTMIETEKKTMQAAMNEILSYVQRTQQKISKKEWLYQQQLKEERELHAIDVQEQDKKLQQLLNISTGSAATSLQLQQRKLAQQQQQIDLLSQSQAILNQSQNSLTAQSVNGNLPIGPAALSTSTIDKVAAAAADFNVKEWLQSQSKSSAAPATLNHSMASTIDPSFNPAASMSSMKVVAPPRAVGQSPQAQLQQLHNALYDPIAPPAFSLPSSAASSIHSLQQVGPSRGGNGAVAGGSVVASYPPSHVPSQLSSTLTSTVSSPYLQAARPAMPSHHHHQHAPNPAATLPPPVSHINWRAPYSASVAPALSPIADSRTGLNDSHFSTSINSSFDGGAATVKEQQRAHAVASQMTRNIHVQRLAEVEAALQAIEEVGLHRL